MIIVKEHIFQLAREIESHLTDVMRFIYFFITLPLAICLVSNATPPKGFVALFNGENLEGWWGAKTEDPEKWMSLSTEEFQKKWMSSQEDIKKHWSVENGELVNDGKGLYLTTEKNFGDFELTLEYKTVAGADSGIYLRGVPQVQIWDTTKEGGKWKLEQIKALEVSGTTDRPAHPAEIHWCLLISLWVSGTGFTLP